MSYSFERVNVGPWFIPGITSSDKEIENINIRLFGKHFAFLKHKKLFTDYTVHPSVSFNINILASLALKEIIFYLINAHDFALSIDREVFFNPLNLTIPIDCA
jgi:hypothetical protein